MKEFLTSPSGILFFFVGGALLISIMKTVDAQESREKNESKPSLVEIRPREGVTCFKSETFFPQYTQSISCFKE